MISLNFSNMMDEVLGEKGVSRKQLEGITGLIEKAHNSLAQRTSKGLDFLDLVSQDTAEIKTIAASIKESAEDFIVLGIGGSALGPRAILEALSPFHNLSKKPRVFICDNVDPGTFRHVMSLVNLKKTVVNVITKSGSTAETMASFMVIWEALSKAVGKEPRDFVIATTDPLGGNLRKIANDTGMRTLTIPSGVGGRYSVLSPVGLLPAEVIGVDSAEMLRGARDIHEVCLNPNAWENPAYLFGSLLYLMNRDSGRNINVMIPYADGLKPFSEWFCQLWAESLGKNGLGMTPYPSLGTVDQHSQMQMWMQGPEDKVVTFIKVIDYGMDIKIPQVFNSVEGISYLSGHTFSELIKAEEESSELALAENRRPNMTISLPAIDPYHLGQLFHFFGIATAFTGFLLGVNPFDQPGVEEGKNFTYGMMGKKGFDEKRKEVEAARGKKTAFMV